MGCSCESQWRKIDGQPWIAVFHTFSILFSSKLHPTLFSVAATFKVLTTATKQSPKRSDGRHDGWNIRGNADEKLGIWKRFGW